MSSAVDDDENDGSGRPDDDNDGAFNDCRCYVQCGKQRRSEMETSMTLVALGGLFSNRTVAVRGETIA